MSPRIETVKHLLIVARQSAQLQLLRRIARHIVAEKTTAVTSIAEAEGELIKWKPSALIVDVSDFRSDEIQWKLEPFLLSLPGWIKIFFVDSKPTRSRVYRASELGVNGVLRAPLSHHGITLLINELSDDEEELS